MHEDNQVITIKGTKAGLTLLIDEEASWQEIIYQLEQLLEQTPKNSKKDVPVTVEIGKRYLSDKQKTIVKNIIEENSEFFVQTFQSDVILKSEAIELQKESEVKVINRVVRSGQILEINGDLLLIGDVNPDAKVIATGNIYILGHLLGVAHAGAKGDRHAFIVASYMKPNQLRIADYISRAPDYESSGVYMECGHIDEVDNKIKINRLQALSKLQIDMSGFERRIQNG